MKEQDLVNFINWLIESKEAPEGSSFEETVSWINELSTSEDGKQILNQLLNTYKKSNNMGLFKKGGKFDYLLCLKKGGNIQDCGCGKKIEKNQPGGPIARMGVQPKEEFTEAEKQALSDGTFYEEVTYPDGYFVTRMSSGSHGKNQRYPFIYSKIVAPDGSVLYQQDQYRNYPLINKSPKLIDINDVSYNLGDGEAWFNKYKSTIDGENLNSPRTKTNKENDLLEYQKGGEILQQDAVTQYPYASRQDVIKAMNQTGLNNKEARQVYRGSKREMRDLGLRGRSLRQAARYNLIDQVYPRAGMTEEEARRAMLDNLITKISYN